MSRKILFGTRKRKEDPEDADHADTRTVPSGTGWVPGDIADLLFDDDAGLENPEQDEGDLPAEDAGLTIVNPKAGDGILSGQDTGVGNAGSVGAGLTIENPKAGDGILSDQDTGVGGAGSVDADPTREAGVADAEPVNDILPDDDGSGGDPGQPRTGAVASHSPPAGQLKGHRKTGPKKGILKPGRKDRRPGAGTGAQAPPKSTWKGGSAATPPLPVPETERLFPEDDGTGSPAGSSAFPRFSLLEEDSPGSSASGLLRENGPGSTAMVPGSGLFEEDRSGLSATIPGSGLPGEDGPGSSAMPPGFGLLEEDGIASSSGGTVAHHGLFARLRRKNGSSNGSSIAGGTPGNGKKPGIIPALFSKKFSTGLSSIPFDPGLISEPSLEGELRDVSVTYPVDPPFQYVHIEFDEDEGSMLYQVLEPDLSRDEEFAISVVEQGFEKMISTNLDLIAGGDRAAYLKEKFLSLLNIFGIAATDEQFERMFFHLKKKYLGYSHMDTLMKDKYIEDISCNGSDIYLYVMHRIYGSVQTDVKFAEVELNNFVLKLAQIGGRHISLLQPIRDVTLPDGSRANLTLGGEVTKKGSTFTIRKFRSSPISPIEMMDYGTIDAPQLAYLWILMENKRSILVSGGTATGKTTMLNVLCAFIPTEYKIVSIEDTAELNLMSPNWIQSVTRTGFGASEGPSGASGVSGVSRRSPGDISLYDLLVAALRQRPEFIIVGEVRGDEAFTLFQAIAVGHAALGTIHAGSINELMARIESNPMNVPRSLFSNLDAVIFPMHIMRGERSARRVANIVEVLELDRDTGDLITNTAFKWVPDRDEFRFQGRTFLFDKIRDTYGISRDLLKEEMQNRIRFLEWLQRREVRDYHLVVRMLRHYQRNKELVLARMEEDGELSDLLAADQVSGLSLDDHPAPTLLAEEELLLED